MLILRTVYNILLFYSKESLQVINCEETNNFVCVRVYGLSLLINYNRVSEESNHYFVYYITLIYVCIILTFHLVHYP